MLEMFEMFILGFLIGFITMFLIAGKMDSKTK